MTDDQVDRTDPHEAIRQLRKALVAARHKTDRWRDWALELESQMRREGWTKADFDSINPDRPE